MPTTTLDPGAGNAAATAAADFRVIVTARIVLAHHSQPAGTDRCPLCGQQMPCAARVVARTKLIDAGWLPGWWGP